MFIALALSRLAARMLLATVLLLSVASLQPVPQVAAASAQAQGCLNLFTDSAIPAALSSTDESTRQHTTHSTHFVNVNSEALNADKLATGSGNVLCLNLFPHTSAKPGVFYKAVLDQASIQSPHRLTWQGHLEGIRNSWVTLAVENGALVGNIRTLTKTYAIRYTGNGTHAIYEINPAAFPPEQEAAPLAHLPSAPPAQSPGAARDDGSVFDILIVYTADARAAAGGTDAMNAAVDTAVAEFNTALQNSQLTQRVRLVYKGEVTYTETGNSNTDLDRLQNPNDGFLDDVPRLRNQYGADMVSMVTEKGGCGLGGFMGTLSATFESQAYSVISRSCFTGNLSLPHEMGHNMGLNHDRANGGAEGGAFPYAVGYQDPDGAFRTIMGYPTGCKEPCPRLPYYSNPNVRINGKPAGVDQNAPNSAYAALDIQNVANTVANFRQTAGTVTCYTLTTTPTPPEGGSVQVNQTPNCNGNKYFAGTVLQLTANPNQGYGFNGWAGDATGGANPITVVMNGNKAVTANFQRCYALTTNVAGGGSVNANPQPNCNGGTLYTAGTNVMLTAQPDTGSTFVNWSGDASGTANPLSLTMDGAKNVTANFAGCIALTLSVVPDGSGSINANPPPNCNGTGYTAGTMVTLTPNPGQGSTFSQWGGDANGNANPLNLTLNNGMNVAAVFQTATTNDAIGQAKTVELPGGGQGASAKAGGETSTYIDVEDTYGASDSADDPPLCSGDDGAASVWYKFTPSQNGLLHVDTSGSDYDTVVAVWSGTEGDLFPDGCDSEFGHGKASQVFARVQAGMTYYIEVADAQPPDENADPGPDSGGGLLELRAQFRSHVRFLPLLAR